MNNKKEHAGIIGVQEMNDKNMQESTTTIKLVEWKSPTRKPGAVFLVSRTT